MSRQRTPKPRTYRSVNAMLRATLGRKEADRVIDECTEQLVAQNLHLSVALQRLVEAVTTDGPSTVTCPDRRLRDRCRRACKRYGVWLTGDTLRTVKLPRL